MELRGALLALSFAIACLVALLAYWSLAFATIDNRKYKFGFLFWFGMVCAAFTIGTLLASSITWFWLAVVSPVVASTSHFAYVQLRLRRALESVSQ
jgi:ATP/ADP translocase